MSMKPIPVVCAFFLGIVLFAGTAFALCVEPGNEAPDMRIPKLDGGTFSLSSMRGKIVLLAFWASWCPRCEEELTYLQGIYKTSPDIAVIAINQESQNISHAHVERIRKAVGEWKIEFPVLLDRNLDAWNSFCINALPTSIILDKKGVVRFAEPNYYWASQEKIADVISAIRLGK
jgi:peroxiredoxin